MLNPRELARLAHAIQSDVEGLGLGAVAEVSFEVPTAGEYVSLYDRLVLHQSLRSATRKLYVDAHYARAVEEAYKCLNNTVKEKAGVDRDGQTLMQQVFSENKPILKVNEMRTQSERDEQVGYMHILSGCMRGLRNPRSHEHTLSDPPETALELLVLANHLIAVVERSTRS